MALGIKKAFILAGGKGDRLKPLTDNVPKVVLEVGNKPILQWNIELAKKYGAQEVILGVGHLHEKIRDCFGNGKKLGVKIRYSVEKEFLGTAGALKLAEPFLKKESRFIMMNGDEVKDVHFEELHAVFEAEKAWAADALVPTPDVSRSGSVKLDGNYITDFLEKTALPQNEKGLVNAGAYVLSNRIFSLIPKNQSFSIEKNIFPLLAKQKKMVGLACMGQWFQTDTLEKLQTARQEWTTRFD